MQRECSGIWSHPSHDSDKGGILSEFYAYIAPCALEDRFVSIVTQDREHIHAKPIGDVPDLVVSIHSSPFLFLEVPSRSTDHLPLALRKGRVLFTTKVGAYYGRLAWGTIPMACAATSQNCQTCEENYEERRSHIHAERRA